MLTPRTPPGKPAVVEEPTAAMRVIAGLLADRTGQQLGSSRAWRIDSALQPLLRARGFADLDALAFALAGERAEPLARAVVEALLNQETSFYRDAGVIEAVADALSARREQSPLRRLRVWSAGCSTGQEPYSLAMLLAERAGPGGNVPDIVASDVSDAAIARARAGRYSHFEIQRGLPTRRMIGWFEPDGEEWVAVPSLARLVSFRRQNLVADAPPVGQFDIVLCRNVLLYFPPAARTAAFARLASALRPDGLLLLGAGETTIGQTELFRPSRGFRGAYELVGDTARMRPAA